MPDARLQDFVEASLRAGATKEDINAALKTSGWSADQIRDSLDSFADVAFVVPIPKPKAQLSARDAFRYLIVFSMLYVSGFYLGDLLFQFVNLVFPDDLNEYRIDSVERSIRWATSALLVSFPLFLFLSYRIASEIAADPSTRNSAVRRWLTYLTLAIAASIIVGDLIVVLYSFLSGELSVRFLLKTLIVLCIAGAIFGYYLWSNKADDRALSG